MNEKMRLAVTVNLLVCLAASLTVAALRKPAETGPAGVKVYILVNATEAAGVNLTRPIAEFTYQTSPRRPEQRIEAVTNGDTVTYTLTPYGVTSRIVIGNIAPWMAALLCTVGLALTQSARGDEL